MVLRLREALRSVEELAEVLSRLGRPAEVLLQLEKVAWQLGVVVVSVYRVGAVLLCGWGAALPLLWEPKQ